MTFAETYRTQLLAVLQSVDLAEVNDAIALFERARRDKRYIFVFGNGGSATTASHLVTDVVKAASYGRELRFRILALNESYSTLTAYSNDVAYEVVFEEQLKNFAEPNDLVVAISGSGNSPNVVRAVAFANQQGCHTLAMTGRDGGRLAQVAQHNVRVQESHMGRIEDAHLMICHMIAYHFVEI